MKVSVAYPITIGIGAGEDKGSVEPVSAGTDAATGGTTAGAIAATVGIGAGGRGAVAAAAAPPVSTRATW